MQDIHEYLIGVVAAALLCGAATTLVGSKNTMGVVVKLMAGLLMLLAVIRPWVQVSLNGISGWNSDLTAEGMGIVSSGEKMAEEAYRASIKQQLEAYILDEAKALDCALTVEVILSDEQIPVPIRATLSGDISPYARQTITTLLTEKLGIQREDQIWT